MCVWRSWTVRRLCPKLELLFKHAISYIHNTRFFLYGSLNELFDYEQFGNGSAGQNAHNCYILTVPQIERAPPSFTPPFTTNSSPKPSHAHVDDSNIHVPPRIQPFPPCSPSTRLPLSNLSSRPSTDQGREQILHPTHACPKGISSVRLDG
jgi:hypothetical protein